MKRLGKLKLFALGAVLLWGMSSCIKSSDPGFQFGVASAYMLQTRSGENATFRPVIRIYSYEPFHNAVARCNGSSYYFTAANSAKTVMDMEYTNYTLPADSIPVGEYQITASNAEEETNVIGVSFAIDKKLGNLNVTELTYTANGGVKASWEKVENATNYYFLWRSKDDKVWQISSWDEGNASGLTSGTYNFSNFEKGTEIYVAVGASYRLLLQASTPVLITLGTDLTPETPAE